MLVSSAGPAAARPRAGPGWRLGGAMIGRAALRHKRFQQAGAFSCRTVRTRDRAAHAPSSPPPPCPPVLAPPRCPRSAARRSGLDLDHVVDRVRHVAVRQLRLQALRQRVQPAQRHALPVRVHREPRAGMARVHRGQQLQRLRAPAPPPTTIRSGVMRSVCTSSAAIVAVRAVREVDIRALRATARACPRASTRSPSSPAVLTSRQHRPQEGRLAGAGTARDRDVPAPRATSRRTSASCPSVIAPWAT